MLVFIELLFSEKKTNFHWQGSIFSALKDQSRRETLRNLGTLCFADRFPNMYYGDKSATFLEQMNFQCSFRLKNKNSLSTRFDWPGRDIHSAESSQRLGEEQKSKTEVYICCVKVNAH